MSTPCGGDAYKPWPGCIEGEPVCMGCQRYAPEARFDGLLPAAKALEFEPAYGKCLGDSSYCVQPTADDPTGILIVGAAV